MVNSHHFIWHLERPNCNINRYYNDLLASRVFLIVLRDPKGSGGTHHALVKHLIPLPQDNLPEKNSQGLQE